MTRQLQLFQTLLWKGYVAVMGICLCSPQLNVRPYWVSVPVICSCMLASWELSSRAHSWLNEAGLGLSGSCLTIVLAFLQGSCSSCAQ